MKKLDIYEPNDLTIKNVITTIKTEFEKDFELQGIRFIKNITDKQCWIYCISRDGLLSKTIENYIIGLNGQISKKYSSVTLLGTYDIFTIPINQNRHLEDFFNN